MASELEKRRRRKNALSVLDEIARKEEHVLLIHYSCENFYDRPEGKSPRVTSIAVRNFLSGQTISFSIHKVAELKAVPFDQIEQHYDQLEKEMLEEFFAFMGERRTHIWVHWNMRDMNYGFPALEHRLRTLGGDPVILEDSKKVDLARLLVALFGPKYVGHHRLEKLIEKNNMTKMDFLTGAQEADAFDGKEYVRLHQSTLRKADTFGNILSRTMDGTLKTNAKWWEIYGINPKLWLDMAKEHWIVTLLTLAASLLGLYLGVSQLFQSY